MGHRGHKSDGGTKPWQPSGSWHLPHRSLASPRPLGKQEKGVRLQVWAPPEGDPSWKLFGKEGAILSNTEIQYLCQENGARPVPRLRLGGDREQPSSRGHTKSRALSEQSTEWLRHS